MTQQLNPFNFSTDDLAGVVVTWYVPGGVDITHEKVLEALTDADLPHGVAHELHVGNAFTRACRHLKEERVIRKVDNKGDETTFQFTQEKLQGSKFEYDYECQLTLTKSTGVIVCNENPALALHATQLLQIATHARTTSDITRIIKRLFETNADLFSIAPEKGGVYFVPVEHREFVQKVSKFATTMGGRLRTFPVPKGDAEGDASVRDAVAHGLGELIGELDDVVEKWSDSTKQDTFERHSQRFQVARHKIECYSQYLGEESARLIEKLNQAKQHMIERSEKLLQERAETDSQTTGAA